MGINNKLFGKTVAKSISALNLDEGTVECDGTAEVTFTHSLGVVPTMFWASTSSTGTFAPYFKGVPTAVGGTLYSVGSCNIKWMVAKSLGA
jgi:hypothetical protein